MAEKDFKISFFQVDMLTNTRSFHELLQEAEQLSPEERTSSKYTRLDNISFDSRTQIWYGSLTKIRMTNLPEKINHNNGERAPLPIADDEGIAEMTVFLYDPEVKMLLIQKSQYAPQISVLGDYLQERFATLPIDFRIV